MKIKKLALLGVPFLALAAVLPLSASLLATISNF